MARTETKATLASARDALLFKPGMAIANIDPDTCSITVTRIKRRLWWLWLVGTFALGLATGMWL